MTLKCDVCDGEILENWDVCPFCNTKLKTPNPYQVLIPSIMEKTASNPQVLDKMEVLIMRAIYPPDCYAISLTFKKDNLPLIKRALEPLGYTLRFPRRSSSNPIRGVLLPPIPESSPHQKLEVTRLPELEKPENARWLALLIDCEGAIGWTRYRKDRINDYRYVYRIPYVGVGMMTTESKETIEEACKLLKVKPITRMERGIQVTRMSIEWRKALKIIQLIRPHQVKFRRLATLIIILYRKRIAIPIEQFDNAITQLFGKYVTSREANEILTRMSKKEYKILIKKARRLAL